MHKSTFPFRVRSLRQTSFIIDVMNNLALGDWQTSIFPLQPSIGKSDRALDLRSD